MKKSQSNGCARPSAVSVVSWLSQHYSALSHTSSCSFYCVVCTTHLNHFLFSPQHFSLVRSHHFLLSVCYYLFCEQLLLSVVCLCERRRQRQKRKQEERRKHCVEWETTRRHQVLVCFGRGNSSRPPSLSPDLAHLLPLILLSSTDLLPLVCMFSTRKARSSVVVEASHRHSFIKLTLIYGIHQNSNSLCAVSANHPNLGKVHVFSCPGYLFIVSLLNLCSRLTRTSYHELIMWLHLC